VSFLIALLILRSVYRRDDPAKLALPAALVALSPYAGLLLGVVSFASAPASRSDHWHMAIASVLAPAVLLPVFRLILSIRRQSEIAALALVIGFCLVAWGSGGQVSADRLGESFDWSLPLVMLVSFGVALVILLLTFRSEGPAKAIFAAVLLAQLACALPSDVAVLFGFGPDSGLNGLVLAAIWALIVSFFPAALLLVVWLLAVVRHSLRGERSYRWEACAAALLGVATVWWAAYSAWWATFDSL
jgi:hypothetical protein